jgi:hypothetical protein
MVLEFYKRKYYSALTRVDDSLILAVKQLRKLKM